MIYPEEYIQYLVYFHGNRDYFECHEVLEEYWKQVDSGNRSSIWVGLIQVAVSMYHFRRENDIGAIRTLRKAIEIFQHKRDELTTLGIHSELFLEQLNEQLETLYTPTKYQSMSFPIQDPVLLKECIKRCKDNGYNWGNKSDLTQNALIHRHQLRDRSDVIQARQKALQQKKRSLE
ncbi:DUF309 domain-containing protein [Bacillus sp. 2205SS5-2]|uniref:DUF309 domain-containing protein n=1 Tax=Bacillus sp. 2205SS5-2 TaxID=3109031 RepID=UPI00300676B8